jgi:GNAT superfamily N-acetyltransferase
MTVIGDVLRDGDLDVLARLHVETLPESLVSTLGPRYARAFYRYISSSSDEVVFMERCGSDGVDVAGACIVSLHPETLNRRLLRATPLIAMALLAMPRLLPRLLPKASGAQMPGTTQPAGPEIILIFTMPTLRSRGCGARLLMKAESWLAARGVVRLYVKTRDAEDNRAIGFYRRAGFQPLGSIVNRGKKLLLLDKSLSHGLP